MVVPPVPPLGDPPLADVVPPLVACIPAVAAPPPPVDPPPATAELFTVLVVPALADTPPARLLVVKDPFEAGVPPFAEILPPPWPVPLLWLGLPPRFELGELELAPVPPLGWPPCPTPDEAVLVRAPPACFEVSVSRWAPK